LQHSFPLLRAREARLPLIVLAVITGGAIVRLSPLDAAWSGAIWLGGLALTGAPVVWRTLRDATRGRFATDIVAMLAIVGAVVLDEPVAGLVVVLMQTGGEALEQYAVGRASRAIRELEEAAPRVAHRLSSGGQPNDIPVDEILVGDSLLVRPGELIPCDAAVLDGRSLVDASRLTGEPVPVEASSGVRLMSGSVNGDGVLTLRALAPARESQYAKIVDLVRTAQASKSPLQRLADRYAVWFTPLTLVVCAAAYVVTRDWDRVLAVLVVATPCPLILATPIAIIGGISRSARRQIIVRHGGALEQLSTVDTAVFDKTGTVTIGKPAVSRVVVAEGWCENELLRLAAAVEQGSSHLLARTVVDAARSRGLALPPAQHHNESAGRGLSADVEGREVAVGARAFILERYRIAPESLAPLEREEHGLRAYVAVDERLAGVIEYADQVRPGLHDLFDTLRTLGVTRTLLLSGDHSPNVRAVAQEVGISDARGDLLPEAKVRAIQQLSHEGARVLMVGDGTNDAPALSTANVGIALAGHGGGITAEAADIVILVDDLGRVVEAIEIAKRTLRVARQSIWVGLGLSGVAMLFAARGLIPPTMGALLQEGIDVAVIVNALRTSAVPKGSKRRRLS
jgi:heavy metal translocating P-type ATPase